MNDMPYEIEQASHCDIERNSFTDSAASLVTQICTCVQLLHLYTLGHMQ